MEVREHGLYIAGKSVPASLNETADVLDPATNRPFASVACGTRDDVNAAVEAARAAFNSPECRDLDPSKR
ncbi:MAG TPA: aldehyde dehydrogenase family protein, partial [Thermoplasmata archaeon]|nr:aldehyde dehydrogenase family protein [Thermoplasmata archaeon]